MFFQQFPFLFSIIKAFHSSLISYQFLMKRQSQRSKSQDSITTSHNNEVNVTILLSQQEQVTVPVPINCPLDIINSLLTQKISQLQSKQVVGFQSVPSNYSLDYKLSKNIGVLNQKKNLTFNCLYKPSLANNSTNQDLSLKISPENFQLEFFRKINKYTICKPLSSGGFSRVYLVRNLQNGQFFAAKFMEKSSHVNIDRDQAIKNEFLVHKSLDHPFVVKMEEYIETEEFYILIMEYCPGGQLFTLLKNNRYMGEQKAKVIFIQILLALKYLHDRNIVFRDIKPENILIDALGNAKLTDFGLAKEIRGKTNSYCGSVEYMAPEIVSKQSYSFDVDLYCMGALLYEILIGCPPFYNPNFSNNETKYHICNSEVCFPHKVFLSEEVKDLITQLLVKNPSDRLGHYYGVEEIIKHEWVGEISTETYLKGEVKNPFIPDLDVQNFDRQQDQYELSFRNKILKEMKKCKKICDEINFINNSKQNPESKTKSQSLNFGVKKHSKSKSQEDFVLTFNKKKQFETIKPLTFTKNWYQEKENPYSLSIKNKSMSQMIYGHNKSENKQQIDQKAAFKKKKLHRTLSRSVNKSTTLANKNTFDLENTLKVEMNKVLLVNSKSCSNSRKNSLYKKFILNGHQNKSNKLDFMNVNTKAKLVKPSNIRQSVPSKQFSVSNSKEDLHSRDKTNSKQKIHTRQKQQLYIPNRTFEKQNIESKGLKRKNMIKKKFMFASTTKDANTIKQSHFMFERSPYEKQITQNRQTVL